jgi:hypothetical protein
MPGRSDAGMCILTVHNPLNVPQNQPSVELPICSAADRGGRFAEIMSCPRLRQGKPGNGRKHGAPRPRLIRNDDGYGILLLVQRGALWHRRTCDYAKSVM